MKRQGLREALSALGVIASLVFVGYEIRENTKVARAATYQAIGFDVLETFRQHSHDPQFALIRTTAEDSTRWAELSEADWFQLKSSLIGSFRAWEGVYRQVEEGLLPEEALGQFGYGWEFEPWHHQLWPSIEGALPDDFAEFIRDWYDLP